MNTIEITNDIRNFVIEKHDDNMTSAKIMAHLQVTYDLSGNEARKTYNAIRDSEGWTSSSTGNITTLVKVMRDNHGKLERKELVKLMAAESGYTESTANHMLSQLNFAKEYHKQELEAQK